ncbi:hypothetical protein [Zoogloea sp.]|uniref:hypothetical protein n=1 Tax=Zoogloea sp. TaxID=49181 RepID=UPI00262D2C9F|nr:hypothetical protein [uncultured Zoogloea sp.]
MSHGHPKNRPISPENPHLKALKPNLCTRSEHPWPKSKDVRPCNVNVGQDNNDVSSNNVVARRKTTMFGLTMPLFGPTTTMFDPTTLLQAEKHQCLR